MCQREQPQHRAVPHPSHRLTVAPCYVLCPPTGSQVPEPQQGPPLTSQQALAELREPEAGAFLWALLYRGPSQTGTNTIERAPGLPSASGVAALLTKPLPITRQSPLRESQSLLVKWNCASWELRNRGPRVVCGQQGGLWVTAGGGGPGSGLREAGCESYQQLLRDELHDQLLGPLVSLPAGDRGSGERPLPTRPARPPPRPARPPPLTGSRPGSRRPGRGGPASASRWSQSRVCASVAGVGGVTGHSLDAPACPTHGGRCDPWGQPPAPTGIPKGTGHSSPPATRGRHSRPAACC